MLMEFEIRFDREEDGRWIAEIEALPGVLAYGETKLEAQSKAEALALSVIEVRATSLRSATRQR
jgi:predicted RNase H-like HicB family nuclease